VSEIMPAQLLALTGGPSILLDKPILLLGRDPECDIQLDSPKVSRRHCCIAQVGESLVVRDLASTNGVRINGVRVVEGHLKEGDELTVGNHRFQVRWDALGIGAAKSDKEVKPSKDARPNNVRAGQPGDELLESADEPVPLADPSEGPVDVPKARPLPAGQKGPAASDASSDRPDPTPSAPVDELMAKLPDIPAPVGPLAPVPPPPGPPPS
jgi:predicted component of type VI protein secretion system